jgi:hypothetical protein
LCRKLCRTAGNGATVTGAEGWRDMSTADMRWQLHRPGEGGPELVADCATTDEVLAAVESEPGLHIQGYVSPDYPHVRGSVSVDLIKAWLAEDAWTDADELREVAATVERVLTGEGVADAARLAALVAETLGRDMRLKLRYDDELPWDKEER